MGLYVEGIPTLGNGSGGSTPVPPAPEWTDIISDGGVLNPAAACARNSQGMTESSAGVFQQAAPNTPRFQYKNGVRYYFSERETENLLYPSNSKAPWALNYSYGGSIAEVDGDVVVILNGTPYHASAKLSDAITASGQYYTVSTRIRISTGSATLSLQRSYLSLTDANWSPLTLNLSTGTITTVDSSLESPSATKQGDYWVVTFRFKALVNGASLSIRLSTSASSGVTVKMRDWQCEKAYTATSEVRTTTAPAKRLQDETSAPLSAVKGFVNKGSIVCTFLLFPGVSGARIVGVASSDEQTSVTIETLASDHRIVVRQGGVVKGSITISGGLASGVFHRIAMSVGEYGIRASENGGLVKHSPLPMQLSGLEKVMAGTAGFTGLLGRVAILPREMSDDELVAASSLGALAARQVVMSCVPVSPDVAAEINAVEPTQGIDI